MRKLAKGLLTSLKAEEMLVTALVPTAQYRKASEVLLAALVKKELGGIYITTSRPSASVIKNLEKSEINMDEVFFIDAISHTVGGDTSNPRSIYLESPTMLESIMLNIELLLRRIRNESVFVYLDNINSIALYSKQRLMNEFIHVLSNNLRLRDIFTVMLTVKEQTSPELLSVLQLLSDRIITTEERK